MPNVSIKGNAELRRYINGIKSWLQLEVPVISKEEAEKGKAYAASIAPKQTGALISAINTRKNSSNSYTLVARTPKGNNNPRRVPYQVYLHYGKRGNYSGGKKSGDHQFMNTTYDFLLNRYPKRMEQELERQLNKK